MTEGTANSIVAANVYRLRRERGWTQHQLANGLTERDDKRWSVSMVSDAERSVSADRADGRPPRQFTADELVALARVYQVSLMSLFVPSPYQSLRIGAATYTRDDFVDLVLQFPPPSMPDDFEGRLRDQYELRNARSDRLRWAAARRTPLDAVATEASVQEKD